jgi:hypothetical protein
MATAVVVDASRDAAANATVAEMLAEFGADLADHGVTSHRDVREPVHSSSTRRVLLPPGVGYIRESVAERLHFLIDRQANVSGPYAIGHRSPVPSGDLEDSRGRRPARG